MNKVAAVVLAGGKGRRMKMDTPKQYMDVHGYPLLFYTVKAFENSSVDEIILVTGEDDIEYCRENIVKKYGFKKVSAIVAGGKERYDSVYNGLKSITDCEYVLIHDGARACITQDVIQRSIDCAVKYNAAVAAMPVKDTIKLVSEDGYVCDTPDRNYLWAVQTPQSFKYSDILEAYEAMYKDSEKKNITDDAMVMENYGKLKVKIFMGSYQNVKITTPDDILLINSILESGV